MEASNFGDFLSILDQFLSQQPVNINRIWVGYSCSLNRSNQSDSKKSCALKLRSQTPSQAHSKPRLLAWIQLQAKHFLAKTNPHEISFDIDPLDLKGLIHLYWLCLCLAPVKLEKTTNFLIVIKDKNRSLIPGLPNPFGSALAIKPTGSNLPYRHPSIGTKRYLGRFPPLGA